MRNSIQLNIDLLRTLRNRNGLSQDAMASHSVDKGCSLSVATIKRAELGKPVSYRIALDFARFHGIDIFELEAQKNSIPEEQGSAEVTPLPSSSKLLEQSYLSDTKNIDTKNSYTENIGNSSSQSLFGREYELMQFQQATTICAKNKRGCVFYVRAAAGVGKSALIKRCEEIANHENFIAITVSNNNDNSSWATPFQSMVSQLIPSIKHSSEHQFTSPLPDNVLRNISEHFHLSEEEHIQLCTIMDMPLNARLNQVLEQSSYSEQIDAQNNLVYSLLKHAKQPLLIVIEDLQWASEKLLLLLKQQVPKIANLPVIFMFSARLENDPLDALWRSNISSTPFITLDITPLAEDDAQKMANEYEYIDPDYKRQCLTLANGNPLFLKQLLLNFPLKVGELPSSILSLVSSKLASLEEVDRKAISIASIIGDKLDLDVICHLLNIPEYDPSALIQNNLIQAENNGYVFCHKLISDNIYNNINNKQKVLWHTKIASLYKSKDNAKYAKHLSKASHNLAPTAFIEAAEKLMGKYNYVDALGLVDSALNLSPQNEQFYTLLLLKGALLQLLELPEKALQYFNQAIDNALDDYSLMRAHAHLAILYTQLNRFEEAQSYIKLCDSSQLEKNDLYLNTKLQACINRITNQTESPFFDNDSESLHNLINKADISKALQTVNENTNTQQPQNQQDIHIGILHSQTGFLKELEAGVLRCTLMAINEINNKGGLLGRRINPVLADGKSIDSVFAEKAQELVQNKDIVTIFGCSTSSSRKCVKPIIESANHLLVYPFQYEGIEQSNNIAYVGPSPNQQVFPAIEWLLSKGKRRFALIGSDYIYPKVTNKLIKEKLKKWGTDIVCEHYIPLSNTDFDNALNDIKAEKPDAIISTVVGFDSNQSFLEDVHRFNISKQDTNIMSLVLSEDDLTALPKEHVTDIHTVFSYFQNINDSINDDFVRRYKNIFGINQRIGGYMESAYTGVNLWAKAVQKANSLEPKDILEAMKGTSYYAPGGMVYFDEENNHVWRHTRIAAVDDNKEYNVLWNSAGPIKPEPFPKSIQNVNWNEYLETIQKNYQGKWENITKLD